MKRTITYLYALLAGLFVGWLSQQFWLGSTPQDPSSISQALTRQFQRLDSLRAMKKESSVVSVQPDFTNLSKEKFYQAVSDKKLELAIEYFSHYEQRQLEDLLLLSELMFEQERFELLFSSLYEFRYGSDTDTERKLLAEIYRLSEQSEKVLADKNAVTRLVALYRQLVSLEADHTPYYLRLSYWLLQAGEPYEASQSLLGAVNDIQFESQVNELQKAISQYEMMGASVEIPLRQSGDHYLITVSFNAALTLDLMIDTGASKTVIKRSKSSVLLNSNAGRKKIQMNTANGKATGQLLELEFVELGDFKFDAKEVVVMPLPNFQHDGLLGMDILSQFQFSINQEDNLLILSPKKPALGSKA